MAFASRDVAAGLGPVRGTMLVLLAAAFVQCGGAQQEPESLTPASYYDPNAETRVIISRGAEEAPDAYDPNLQPSAPAAQSNAQTSATAPKAPLSESQVAAVLDMAADTQLEIARSAQAKTSNAQVKKFASMLIANYNQLREQRADIEIEPAESQLSADMGLDAGRTRVLLSGDGDHRFDKAFIAAQVDIHRKFQSALSEKLLPSAQTPELRALLQDVQAKTERQLKEAEQIHAEIGE